MISAAQCRAARAFLNWRREDLASHAKVSKMTLADFETEKRTPYDRTLADIRRALEVAGVEFRDDGFVGLVRDASEVGIGSFIEKGDALGVSERRVERAQAQNPRR